jgi:tripartite-type tricarboxylate transporter receptor subunit TctC
LVIRLFALSAFLIAVLTGSAAAQDYPNRPVTIVVPFTAGGPTDLVGRVIGERIKTLLGQPVIVENVPGAGGTIGAARVARAAPDGYTLIVGQWSSHVGGGAMYSLSYDQVNDFEPVALLTSSPLWIIGRKELPAKDLKELIAWMKANPDKATAGSVGVGSGTHLCLIYFGNTTGTKFQVVPYRGGPPMMQDLIAGQVDFSCPEASQNLAQYRAGRIKVYAVMSQQRWPAAPEIPTVDEAGVPGMHFPFWNALWAPKGTPKAIVARLNAAVKDAFADADVRKRFGDLGYEIPPLERQTTEALGAYHRAEVEKWFPIIKGANIKPE